MRGHYTQPRSVPCYCVMGTLVPKCLLCWWTPRCLTAVVLAAFFRLSDGRVSAGRKKGNGKIKPPAEGVSPYPHQTIDASGPKKRSQSVSHPLQANPMIPICFPATVFPLDTGGYRLLSYHYPSVSTPWMQAARPVLCRKVPVCRANPYFRSE